MTERLRCIPKQPDNELAAQESPVVRRLRRDELQNVRSSNKMSPQPSERVAVILVLPPTNKKFAKPKEKQHEGPVPEATLEIFLPKQRWPLLEMVNAVPGNAEHSPPVSGGEVPLYNCITMFPDREQRERLHRAVLGLLGAERKRLWRSSGPERHKGICLESLLHPTSLKVSQGHSEGSKHSHAFVISSCLTKKLQPDVVPLAIAMWRVAMWEGCTPDGAHWYNN